MKNRYLSIRFPFLSLSLLTLVGAHMVIDVFGQIHNALFPVFREEFNLSLQQLGVMAAIPPLCQMFSYIPSGLLSDRYGQKTLIILSFLTGSAAALAVSFSNNVFVLTIFLSILRSSVTIFHPPAYSLTSMLLPRESRGRGLGFHNAGGMLGIALGPISVSIFMGYLLWSWRSVYLFWSFPILLYILAIWRLKTPKDEHVVIENKVLKGGAVEAIHADGIRSVFTSGILVFMIYQIIHNMGRQIVNTFIPTYIHDEIGLSVAGASFIYGVASLTGVVAAPIGGYLVDRIGDKRWLMISIGSSVLLLLLSAFTSNIIIFSLLYWSSGFLNFSSLGASSSIIARFTPTSRRGLGYALYFLPGSIISTISPIIGAHVATAFGLWNIFPVSIALIGLSLVILKFGVASS